MKDWNLQMDVERLGCEVLGVEFIGNPTMRVKKLMGAPPGPQMCGFAHFGVEVPSAAPPLYMMSRTYVSRSAFSH